jgi:hypothetical protein
MLRPNGLAPARHPRFAKVPPGVPFASPARESRRALLDCHRANPPGHEVQRLRRAGDGGGETRRCAARRGKIVCGDRGEILRAGSFRPGAAPLACPGAKLSARAGGNCMDARHLAAKLRALRFAGMESRQAASRWRDCAGGIVPRKFSLALRTAGMKDANPAATQEPLSSKPPQCRIPLRVNPRH